MLIDVDALYAPDLFVLQSLAEECATYENATRELKSNGFTSITEKGYEMQSPYVAIRNKALKNIRDISASFGFDPLARMRMNFGTDKKNKNPFDEL